MAERMKALTAAEKQLGDGLQRTRNAFEKAEHEYYDSMDDTVNAWQNWKNANDAVLNAGRSSQ